MAESKATIINAPGNSSTPALINWSSLASNNNNIYFDVRSKDASKLIILVANVAAKGLTATCGKFVVGTSYFAGATGDTFHYPYSGENIGPMQINGSTRILAYCLGATPSTKGDVMISVLGPFETARFKSSQGYIKFSKAKAAGDAGKVWAAGILIP